MVSTMRELFRVCVPCLGILLLLAPGECCSGIIKVINYMYYVELSIIAMIVFFINQTSSKPPALPTVRSSNYNDLKTHGK